MAPHTTTIRASTLPTKPTAAATPQLKRSCSQDFVLGKWDVELKDWRQLGVAYGWMACVCPCVTIAQIYARLDAGSFRSALIRQLVFSVGIVLILAAVIGSIVTGQSLIQIAFSTFLLVSHVYSQSNTIATLRTRVRGRFQIPGTDDDDDRQSLWCGPCVVAQMAAQVQSSKPGAWDFSVLDALPAYIR